MIFTFREKNTTIPYWVELYVTTHLFMLAEASINNVVMILSWCIFSFCWWSTTFFSFWKTFILGILLPYYYYFSNKFYFPFNFNISSHYLSFFQYSHFYASLPFIHSRHGHSQWPPVGSSWRDIIWGSGNAAENQDIEGGFFFSFFPPLFNDNRFFFSPPPQKKKNLVIPSLLKFVGWDESDINHSTSCSSSSSLCIGVVAGLDEFGRHLALLFKSTCQL